jgi:AcrR family transcriptional regulator
VTEVLSSPVRERILAAGYDLAGELGWRRVRMSAVAARAGVSRQTVYDQFSTKENLARGILAVEVDRVVGIAVDTLEAHPDGDPRTAIEAAIAAVLEEGDRNALLKVVLDNGPDGDPELLRLLTSDAAPVYAAVWQGIAPWGLRNFGALGLADVAAVVDVIGRVVVSHLVRPGPRELPVARTVAGMVVSHVEALAARRAAAG